MTFLHTFQHVGFDSFDSRSSCHDRATTPSSTASRCSPAAATFPLIFMGGLVTSPRRGDERAGLAEQLRLQHVPVPAEPVGRRHLLRAHASADGHGRRAAVDRAGDRRPGGLEPPAVGAVAGDRRPGRGHLPGRARRPAGGAGQARSGRSSTRCFAQAFFCLDGAHGGRDVAVVDRQRRICRPDSGRRSRPRVVRWRGLRVVVDLSASSSSARPCVTTRRAGDPRSPARVREGLPPTNEAELRPRQRRTASCDD